MTKKQITERDAYRWQRLMEAIRLEYRVDTIDGMEARFKFERLSDGRMAVSIHHVQPNVGLTRPICTLEAVRPQGLER